MVDLLFRNLWALNFCKIAVFEGVRSVSVDSNDKLACLVDEI